MSSSPEQIRDNYEEILEEKDNIIKELEEILKIANEVIMYSHEHSRSPEYIFRNYQSLLNTYKEKYGK